ncbi:CBASS oligonucleotide cyclase [Microcoleus sp. S13_B4]|uniref:CBASS oligonucleotide cyclase n=1 Tax=Microcoleus sp. S13_B4 TaxID=3055408 RepID=UPI002FD08454
MGGSGGSGWSSSNLSGIDKLVQQANEQTNALSYTSEVNSLLQDALQRYNDRDTDAINKHIEDLKEAIEKELEEESVNLNFGGSVRRHTFIDGLSDVDILVLINQTSLQGKTPKEVLEYFAGQIKQQLPNTEVFPPGKLAVTVRYSDGCEVQLLPAIKTATGFKIASSIDENQWSNVVRPEAFARKLTAVNKACSGKVVPVIKLFKAAVKEVFPTNLKISGYHAESLAIEAFERYEGRKTYKDMLNHLCRTASDRVKVPIKDRTGQSIHVDDYLGSENSKERNRVSSCLGRLATRLEKADRLQSLEEWQKLLGSE